MSIATIAQPETTAPDAVVPMGTRPEYWAGRRASPEQIQAWVEQFHRDGYLLLPKVLPPELCRRLRNDLDQRVPVEQRTPDADKKFPVCELRHRMFEVSDANLSLFDLEPIVSFAEALIANETHVIHNNSFITMPGMGISTWHQDDAPHMQVLDGKPPTNIRLPVLFFTCNYYLTDVEDVAVGGTETIPRSHMLGAGCPHDLPTNEQWKHVLDTVDHNLGPAGSVVMFNNQVWHRGGPNTSALTRYVTQVTYARRIIGHKYHPFMNYQMPEHVYANADARRKRLLGFLSSGAYG